MLLHPGCVLLVDDDPDIRDTVSFVLENAGYCVCSAADGLEAIRRLRTEASPCVILLDLMMPVMNGWEFRAEQARDPMLATIPVVVVTGAGHAAQWAASLEASGVLEKPVDLSALISMVDRYCEATARGPE